MGYASGLAMFVALYSAGEDYSSGALTNPMVPQEFRRTVAGRIEIGAHSALGSSCVVLPGIRLGFGSSVGALSLVNRNVRDYEIVHGNPIRRVGRRDSDTLDALDAALAEQAAAAGIALSRDDVRD